MKDTPINLAQIIFRRAEAADLGAIIRLLAEDEIAAGREQLADPPPSEYSRAFAAISAASDQILAVGELDGKVIATLQITIIQGLTYQGGKRALVEAVRVADNLRGQGVGQCMMQWAIEQARQSGCILMQLTTDNRRWKAHRFYAQLGFESSHLGMKLRL
jgi:GNAT superfamily N-acetyltransferase